jgi:chemotaxis protein MotB
MMSRYLFAALLGLLVFGCGYSEDEWQAQLAKYGKLDAQHKALSKEHEAALTRIGQLEAELTKMGVNMDQLNKELEGRTAQISNLSTSLEERERALAEYKRRAEQLERIRERFELLRKKLEALTGLGLEVKIRNNRMIISLPGDVLFESGKDGLKKEGKGVLDKVASIINGDQGLKGRYYQVAGHTDNVELHGGAFYDNWGLSLLRARTVLLYLIEKGGLPAKQWSAAGFSDTDPVATNDTPDGKQKNRRCEIIVVPSAEEMLDLKAIAQ